jgi:FkbM family methyltransferase
MPEQDPLPLYYPDKTLSDMEAMLRRQYLSQSGWLDSAAQKMALRDGKPLPWFTYSAIAFLERNLPPDLSLFEYGGGQSTLYWADRVKRVVSVDHDPAFGAYMRAALPDNAELRLVGEGDALPPAAPDLAGDLPPLTDPERSTRSYRSGQLNQAFRTYALQLCTYPANSFDVVIVDGMARVLSTWAAIRHFKRDGFIIFDNADRDFYQPAFTMLEEAGYRRLDFWGLGPINPYEWCTSVFYQPKFFAQTRWFPADRPDPVLAPTAAPTHAPVPEDRLGVLVLGYNRPHHLQAVLESLRLQGRIGDAHVWIDGTQGRGEYLADNDATIALARRYKTREIRVQNAHLGIEKMMLDALGQMSGLYDRVLVLEDDCFVLEGGVDAFEAALADIADADSIYSVYGHHFGTEPAENPDFSRFQGWGWAAHSTRIRALLPELQRLFAMEEQTYLDHVAAQMTDTIRDRLDRTPGRNVLTTLQKFFSWDSATAFVTAQRGMTHRRTPHPTVINTGIVPGIGHFRRDEPRLRQTPFNMIPLSEAWARYDTASQPCDFSRDSYGLDRLDHLILAALPEGPPGFFIEIGAYDGVTQSNSVLLENRGWTGLLIEANPGSYARCCRTRPAMITEHAACVPADFPEDHTTITDVGLMSMTGESRFSPQTRADWVERGAGFTGRAPQDIDVPTTTMSALLDKHAVARVDLLLLDVEGAEIDVLKGLDFNRHAPVRIVAEDAYDDELAAYLSDLGYSRTAILLERKFTRDCLYQRL